MPLTRLDCLLSLFKQCCLTLSVWWALRIWYLLPVFSVSFTQFLRSSGIDVNVMQLSAGQKIWWSMALSQWFPESCRSWEMTLVLAVNCYDWRFFCIQNSPQNRKKWGSNNWAKMSQGSIAVAPQLSPKTTVWHKVITWIAEFKKASCLWQHATSFIHMPYTSFRYMGYIHICVCFRHIFAFKIKVLRLQPKPMHVAPDRHPGYPSIQRLSCWQGGSSKLQWWPTLGSPDSAVGWQQRSHPK